MGKEGKRIILAAALSFLVLIVFQFIMSKNQKPAPSFAQKEIVAEEKPAGETKAIETPVFKPAETVTAKLKAELKGEDLIISTPSAVVTFNTSGGVIKHWVLNNYKENGKQVDMVWNSGQNIFPGTLVIPSLKFEDQVLYNGKQTETGAEFTAVVKDEVEIKKTYSFRKESFTWDITLNIKSLNKEVKEIKDAKLYLGVGVNNHFIYNEKGVILQKDMKKIVANMEVFTNIHYLDKKAVKNVFKMKQIVNEKQEPDFVIQDAAMQTGAGELSWLGIKDKYYISVFIPKAGAGARGEEHARMFSPKLETTKDNITKEIDSHFAMPAAALLLPAFDGEKGGNFTTAYYSGPIIYEDLKAFNAGLDRSMELGWSWFNIFGIGMLWLLKWCYAFTFNWGLAIIVVTVVIKAITWWPTQKSYQAMKKMQDIQPEITALKTKYKDDPKKMTEETMRIYKEKKVNPLGGCLPMLLQIPIFVAFYAVLANAIELKNASFLIWSDLSARDPYFVLLILMLGTMILQQKMTPATDPQQAKMMMWLMPAIFAFIFWSLPAGLLLYFTVQNILSILQQWMVNKKPKTVF
ncbi:MAG: membrane protein insertase YidC [Candidatus Firestonebacteria bacterium]